MRAVAADNSQHCAICAVTRVSRTTEIASAASRVDFPDHTLARRQQPPRLRRGCRRDFFDYADEFMTKCSFKSRVSSRDLEIGVADSGERYAHERLAVRSRSIDVSDRELLIFVTERFHF